MSAVEELKATFKRWDTDGSGAITKDELFAIFKALDPSFMDIELDEMMAEADVNKDGKIDVNEFIDWCTGGAGGEGVEIPMGVLWEEKLEQCRRDALRQFSGWSFKVKKHFDNLKERLSADAFQNVVNMYMAGEDDNKDGLISFEEIADVIEPIFEALHQNDRKFKQTKKVDEKQIRAAFDAHDTEEAGKGKLGKDEFSNLIKYLQVISAAAMMQDTVSMWEEQDD